MSIERPHDWRTINGWFGEPDSVAYSLLAQRVQNGLIIEVGSWCGRSAICILPIVQANGSHLVCVDSWDNKNGHEDYEGAARVFYRNLLVCHATKFITPIRLPSVDAAKIFRESGIKADLIFIDGDHKYESVKNDIEAWFPILKPDGVIGGHDFTDGFPGVQQAVRERFPDHDSYILNSAIWTDRKVL